VNFVRDIRETPWKTEVGVTERGQSDSNRAESEPTPTPKKIKLLQTSSLAPLTHGVNATFDARLTDRPKVLILWNRLDQLIGPTFGAAMKILLIDDHKMFCDGLRLIFDQMDFNTELFEAPDARAAFQLLEAHSEIELVMLDIKLPDRHGLDVLKELSQRFPTLPVIMLTATVSRRMIRQSFAAGASGYVLKSSGADVMIGAIRLVLAGGIYVPPNMVTQGNPQTPSPRRDTEGEAELSKLTQRQSEVLNLLQSGSSNKQIADDLGLSESTVKAHISAILRSLNLRSRVQAALLAQKLESGPG
jgi:DNA-binding NarL/FixJ family response regulator